MNLIVNGLFDWQNELTNGLTWSPDQWTDQLTDIVIYRAENGQRKPNLPAWSPTPKFVINSHNVSELPGAILANYPKLVFWGNKNIVFKACKILIHGMKVKTRSETQIKYIFTRKSYCLTECLIWRRMIMCLITPRYKLL